ncbi:MAG: hypothetical protein QOE70_692 [Chthoniobacter sp.]|jgi:hypothetical protein|nr:hypothetical protein [Chthoniobacter sp.]
MKPLHLSLARFTTAFAVVLIWAAQPTGAQPPSAGAVYYLKQAMSVTTDAGIVSAKPGTKVIRLAGAPGGMKVKTEDGTAFTVTMKQVTENPAEAAELAQKEAETQSAVAAQARAAAAAAAADEAQRKQREQAIAREIGTGNPGNSTVAARGSSSGTLTGSALDDKGSGTSSVSHPKKREPVNNSSQKKKR